jgi:hypothetical protein
MSATLGPSVPLAESPVATYRSPILMDGHEVGHVDWCVIELCTYALRMELLEPYRGQGLLEPIVRAIEPQLTQTPVLFWYDIGPAFAAVWDRLLGMPRAYGTAVSGGRRTFVPANVG